MVELEVQQIASLNGTYSTRFLLGSKAITTKKEAAKIAD